MPVNGNHFVAAAEASIVGGAIRHHAGYQGAILHVITKGNTHRGAIGRTRGCPIVAICGSLESSFFADGSPIVSVVGAVSGPIGGTVRPIDCAVSSAVCSPIQRGHLRRRNAHQ